MKTKQSKQRGIFLAAFFLILLLTVVLWQIKGQYTAANAQTVQEEELLISLDSGFYTSAREIRVTVPRGAVVYYTEDGGEPDAENGKLYREPILLAAEEEESVSVYRFRAVYPDGTESRTVNRTYICGKNVNQRYTNNVLCVSGSPEDLFGYETGIFVPGQTYDEFHAKNPDVLPYEQIEANFTWRGRESEREVYAEYFTPEGETIFSQQCGVRIYGALSRVKHRKSFKLLARSEYDEQNEFKYPLLSEFVSAQDGLIAKEHKRLIARASGNDSGFTFIRNELSLRLAAEAGFPDVMYAEPVCVYINGIYYGVYWLENGFDAQYFVNKYGEYEGEFVVLEGSDDSKDVEEDAELQRYVEEYNAAYSRFAAMDLTVDENYEALCKFLDVENYLQYFAIEYMVGNMDWPQNNVRAYRYVAPDGVYQEGTVFDGRYRHMLFDLDYGFGLRLDPEEGVLDKIISSQFPLFKALVERQDCRDYFAAYVCDLFNGAMSSEHVRETLAEMHSEREAELRYMLEEGSLLEDPLWSWEETVQSYEEFEQKYQELVSFAEIYPGTVYSDMTIVWNYSFEKWFCLNLTKNGYSHVRVNTLLVEEDSYTGWYIGDIPLKLEAVMTKNEVFEHWLVNGEIREGEELLLTAEDIVEGLIQVECVVHTVEKPKLSINAVKAKGQNDFVELRNLSGASVSTRGYYLSDSQELYQYALPSEVLAPGETRRYYGKSCTDVEALGQWGLNFNLKAGETLTLTYETEVLETLDIPDLSKNGVYCKEEGTEKFIEVFSE